MADKKVRDAERVLALMADTPDGIIHDADTILKDLIDACDFEETGLAKEIIRIWEGSCDRDRVEQLFCLLTGCSFEDWLERCIRETTRSQPAGIDSNTIERAERVLADNGIDPDECATVLQAIGYVLLDKELYPRT